jgi:hypothetical protein
MPSYATAQTDFPPISVFSSDFGLDAAAVSAQLLLFGADSTIVCARLWLFLVFGAAAPTIGRPVRQQGRARPRRSFAPEAHHEPEPRR